MILEFLAMNGYGFYVWMSFGIVLISCTLVYVRTKKTLKKYEKEYLKELKSLSYIQQQNIIKKSRVANQIYAISRKAN
jgi:heme exporter protein CcmD